MLGAAGLGEFALAYSVILTSTAIGSGMVGDSLTILNRRASDVRSALECSALITPVLTALVSCMVVWALHLMTPIASVVFGFSVVAFLIQTTMRRLLMASMRFWSLVVIDGVSLIGSLLTIVGLHAVGHLSVSSFLVAILVGQVVSAMLAIPLLPAGERHLVGLRRGALAQVFRFGLWRATQQAIRPAMLTAARVLIAAEVGKAIFGQLEAARLYMAPSLLIVQGIASYLLSSYAQIQDAPISRLSRRASRASLLMLALALAVGGIGTLVAPEFGHLITGSTYSMRSLAVFGWAVYAASSAAVVPFASLAAVRGQQGRVVSLRAMDSCISIALVWVVLSVPSLDVSWAPYALAVGSFLGGAAVRALVLMPLVRAEDRGRPYASHTRQVAIDQS